MSRTYNDLKTAVLALCDGTGSVDAGTVAEAALYETMKYVADKIELPKLISSKTFTWGSATTSVPLFTSQGFNITEAEYASPNRLYVRRDSAASAPGLPYEPVAYMPWLDLKAVPGENPRADLFYPNSQDARPFRAYTVNLSDAMEVTPAPSENNVLTFFFNKIPAAYASGTTPEIPSNYDFILVNGGVLILKEWIREPEIPINPHELLTKLDPQIQDMEMHLSGSRKRNHLKLSSRYNI